jgi:hypothetical protein
MWPDIVCLILYTLNKHRGNAVIYLFVVFQTTSLPHHLIFQRQISLFFHIVWIFEDISTHDDFNKNFVCTSHFSILLVLLLQLSSASDVRPRWGGEVKFACSIRTVLLLKRMIQSEDRSQVELGSRKTQQNNVLSCLIGPSKADLPSQPLGRCRGWPPC